MFALAAEDPGQAADHVLWIIAAAVLLSGGTCWFLLRSTSAAAAARARIASVQAALDKALAKILELSEARGRFVSNLALEIRAPLATVLTHAEQLLVCGVEPVTVQRYSKSIAEDVRHLSDLIESFLRLVRPSAHEDISHHVPVHFHDLVVEAVRRCQSLASTREVSVVPTLAEPGSDAAVEVLGDAVLLEAMVENLVRNAVLSAPRQSRVDLRVKVQGEEILLSVRDHGAKVDADRLDSVFDGFFQVPTPPRPTAGTGLSLAIAKRVAEHHRGTISLRNVPEGGCEFEVQLPRWRPRNPPGMHTTPRAVPQMS